MSILLTMTDECMYFTFPIALQTAFRIQCHLHQNKRLALVKNKICQICLNTAKLA